MTNPNSEHITALEAAEILGVTRSALCNRRRAGLTPAWTDIAPPGARSSKVRYILSDVLAFRDERNSEQRPTIAELAVRVATLERELTEREPTERMDAIEGRLLSLERYILRTGKRRAIKRKTTKRRVVKRRTTKLDGAAC